jgi:hypothetical protein
VTCEDWILIQLHCIDWLLSFSRCGRFLSLEWFSIDGLLADYLRDNLYVMQSCEYVECY